VTAKNPEVSKRNGKLQVTLSQPNDDVKGDNVKNAGSGNKKDQKRQPVIDFDSAARQPNPRGETYFSRIGATVFFLL